MGRLPRVTAAMAFATPCKLHSSQPMHKIDPVSTLATLAIRRMWWGRKIHFSPPPQGYGDKNRLYSPRPQTHTRTHTHIHTVWGAFVSQEECEKWKTVRRGRGRLLLHKLACQQRIEERTLARKKKDGSWRAPKHRSWGNEGTNSGRNVI